MRKLNSIHGNNRDVKDVKKKWNNLKGSAKARVDSSRREARRTGGGPNGAGEVGDEDIRILSSDRELSTSVTERVSQMFSSTPAFTGICSSVDLFQAPTALLSHTEISESREVTPVFEGPAEVTVVNSRPEGGLGVRGASNSQQSSLIYFLCNEKCSLNRWKYSWLNYS
ncbi:hypothetical protein LOD99_15956 [Oopsacas minuta]|uniref:Nuclear apoptosis-inducing factor 1 n=1 Tax=Oopsacas minuta TaxID=111878 RepID=A0AAV7K877_9METZ|nr:hypothetical protein LOD99_15956 [Oopsacas minuta]